MISTSPGSFWNDSHVCAPVNLNVGIFSARFAIIGTLLVVCLLLPGCERKTSQPVRFYAFGTLIEITLPKVPADKQAGIESELIETFQHWHDHWHPWEGDEGLAAINRSIVANGRAPIDHELSALLEAARHYYEQSDGLFDPAIGGLVRVWGFNEEPAPAQPPPVTTIDNWRHKRPRLGDTVIQDGTLISRAPGLQLDLGAFAKGYAMEQAAEQLRQRGIHNALINTGGDLLALGRRDERPWHIGIRHPRRAGILASVDLADHEALVTSGDYERYFMHEGKRYHHILDPRSGRPARQSIAVSVIHTDAARADAAATALFIAGPGQWRQMARQLQIEAAMLIDARGRIHLTNTMRKRLHFKSDPDAGIEVTP